MIIDCVADLHGFYPDLEGGDLLIIAGDLTRTDHPHQYEDFFEWLEDQNYKKKIFIGGNHDNYIANIEWNTILEGNIEYLCDSGTEFTIEEDDLELERCGIHPTVERTFKIWGTPWTRTFEGMNPHCMAFTCENEVELEQKWRKIPVDLDILISHSPPHGILDGVTRDGFIEGHQCDKIEHVGSHSLLYYSRMQQPRLHIFGHIHEAYGKEVDEGITTYVNASHVNERYKPVNKPIRIIL